MFMGGAELPSPARLDCINRDTRIALNITAADRQDPYLRDLNRAGNLCGRMIADHHDAVFIPQTDPSIHDLVFGTERAEPEHRDVPAQAYRQLYDAGRVVSFVDCDTWICFLRKRDLVCGTRIHGGIAGILAGTPTHIIAFDSRTLELCRYFGIPHSHIDRITDRTTAHDLYDPAMAHGMLSGHPARFATYLAFLNRNGLRNVFEDGDKGAAFEQKMALVDLPAAVHSLAGPEQAVARMAWMRTYLAYQQQVADERLAKAGSLKAMARRIVRNAYRAVRQ